MPETDRPVPVEVEDGACGHCEIGAPCPWHDGSIEPGPAGSEEAIRRLVVRLAERSGYAVRTR
jgi:hypothetical protein